jgi:hypothetical protein
MGSFENLGYPIPKVTLKGQNLWDFASNGCILSYNKSFFGKFCAYIVKNSKKHVFWPIFGF